MDEKPGFRFPDEFVHRVSEANCYRMPDGIGSEAEYCDFLVDEFERAVAELGADNVACFFAEPIMGAGGVLVAPEGYHRRMKQACEAHDVLYVSDEVVTAFGRLGRFFASEDLFDVVPDILVTAKGITSGYMPLGATIVSDKVFEGLSRPRADGGIFSHGFTYSGHAVACAVALANIGLMEREDLCGQVRRTGPYFLERLQTLGELPIVGDVRGSHFMLCVELVRDRETKEPFPEAIAIGKRVDDQAQARGLIVRPIGNLCVLSPALILDTDDIDRSSPSLGNPSKRSSPIWSARESHPRPRSRVRPHHPQRCDRYLPAICISRVRCFCWRNSNHPATITPIATASTMIVASALMSGRSPRRTRE